MTDLSITRNTQDFYNERKALHALDAAGARFTLCGTRSKQPINKGWQRRGKGKRAAAAHLAAGGNVGMLCGSGGHYLVDLDKLAGERLERFPQLATTKQVLRSNALGERAKCIFHTSGPLPRSRKDKDAGIEILAAGSNAVLLGTHESGAAIYMTDNPIMELSAAECDALWTACGGKDSAPPAAAARLATGSANALDLLNAAIVAGVPGHRHTAGFELARSLRDAGYSTAEARGIMLDYQTTVQHTGSHEYTEGEALATLNGTYSRKVRTTAPAVRNPIHAVIDDLEQRVVSGDIDLSANMERTFLAALDIMHSAESINDVQMPTGEISHRANMPRPTVWRHMRKLVEMGLLKRVSLGNWTEASVFSLGTGARAKMKHPSGEAGGRSPGGVSFWQNATAYTYRGAQIAGMLAEFLHGDELLLAYKAIQQLPLTEPGARIDVRLAENEEQIEWSFGTSAHRLIAHLAMAPAADVHELAERARLTIRTAYRKIVSLKAAGIVVDDGELRLSDAWQERMHAIAPALVTFGRRELRAVAYARQRIAIHTHMLELYESRPLRRRADLADLADDAIKQAQRDLEHWLPQVREANIQRVEWAREHLDLAADAVPPCSLNSNMARERKIRQPVMAHGRPLLPDESKVVIRKNRKTAREQLQELVTKELLTGDELATLNTLAGRLGVQIETVRMELN